MPCGPENFSHFSCRYTGAARTRSRSGRLLPMHHVWRFHLLLRSGQILGERQYSGSVLRYIDDPFHRMFSNKRYEQASVAFQRAGRNREAAICDAYLLREKARLVSTTTSAARIRAFTTAADAFITCARDSPSKQVKERLACYKAAGECYSEARKLKKSGDNYQLAEDYAAAARTYREGGYFDEMVEVITQHGNTLESGLVERLKMAAQLHYFKVYFSCRLNFNHL